jgi:CDGSH-type Zn-finger protein
MTKTSVLKLNPQEKCKLCTCSKSKILPYCDDTHREFNEKEGTSFKSIKIKNIGKEKIELEAESKLWD